MPQIAKSTVDANLRTIIFNTLEMDAHDFTKVNDRQWGILITDLNGTERYVRVGAIVAEERKDMTARELMQAEIDDYTAKQAKKAADKAKNEAKAKADAEKRAAKAAKKDG